MTQIKKHVKNLKKIVKEHGCSWDDFKFSSNGHIHITVSDPEGKYHKFSTGESPRDYDRAAQMFRADLRASLRGTRKASMLPEGA